MKFLRLQRADLSKSHARPDFLLTGTWEKVPESCGRCRPQYRITAPWIVEWKSATPPPGELAWGTSGYEFICRTSVEEKFQQIGLRGEFVTSKEFLYRSRRRNYTKPGIFKPFVPKFSVSIDIHGTPHSVCSCCGNPVYEFNQGNLILKEKYHQSLDMFRIDESPFNNITFASEIGWEKIKQKFDGEWTGIYGGEFK